MAMPALAFGDLTPQAAPFQINPALYRAKPICHRAKPMRLKAKLRPVLYWDWFTGMIPRVFIIVCRRVGCVDGIWFQLLYL
jgi:hypothetical protein